jgi:polysaccharide export outer membrane protein
LGLSGLGCSDSLSQSLRDSPVLGKNAPLTGLTPVDDTRTEARAAPPERWPGGNYASGNYAGVNYAGGNYYDEDAPPPRRDPMPPNRAPDRLAPGPMGPDGAGMPYPPGPPGHAPVDQRPPHELNKVNLPYYIEPPDILLISASRLIPKTPYTVQPLDVLVVRVSESLPNEPIDGLYTLTPGGYLNLGYSYGALRVMGLTLERVEELIRRNLKDAGIKNPRVQVGLAQFRGSQAIVGEHLVRPDGTISLGVYGCLNVTGLTLVQTKCAIERYLDQFLQEPDVVVDVFAYNSKVYYVITDGGGYGQQVLRFPITGNETVLDAIGNIYGLPAQASRKHIWVARPAPCDKDCLQVLPVDWKAITQGGATCTNYQLFPGDRVYVKADPLITFDNTLAKVFSPIERVLGIALLTGTTFQAFRNNNGFNNGNGGAAVIVR